MRVLALFVGLVGCLQAWAGVFGFGVSRAQPVCPPNKRWVVLLACWVRRGVYFMGVIHSGVPFPPGLRRAQPFVAMTVCIKACDLPRCLSVRKWVKGEASSMVLGFLAAAILVIHGFSDSTPK